MPAPTIAVMRHEAVPHDPAYHEVWGDTLVTVICGRITSELDRIATDHGRTITYEARIDGIPDIGAGIAGIHADYPQALRDLATVAGFLADEMHAAAAL